MKHTAIRFPDRLYDEIEKAAKQQGVSVNQWLQDASTHTLSCSKSRLEGPRLMRSPIDTHCSEEGCKKEIRFGAWCYYHPQEGTLCPECGVKRGWTGRDRIRRLIENYELKHDNQEVKREIKEDLEKLTEIKAQLNIYKLGTFHEQLTAEQKEYWNKVQKYLMDLPPGQEKDFIQTALDEIQTNEEWKEQIKEEIGSRLLFQEKKKKRKKEQLAGVA